MTGRKIYQGLVGFMLLFSTSSGLHADTTTKQESCPLDGEQAVALGAKKGYGFSGVVSKGEARCEIKKGGVILIVSATSDSDGACTFSVFVPPPKKRTSAIIRVGLKAKHSGVVQYLQGSQNDREGFSVNLIANKGETQQYRITVIEVLPINNQCDGSTVGAQL